MPLTSSIPHIARGPADRPGGDGSNGPGGPQAQRPLVPGIPSRRVDPSGVVTQQNRHLRPGQQQGPRGAVAEEGELVVGHGITVRGGIHNCHRLVVHGTVQATVPCDSLEIGPDGVFEGRSEVKDATIAGRFDGDLLVDGALTVAPGGLVKGRVRYRSLRVESGGHLSADIDHIDTAPQLEAEPQITADSETPVDQPESQANGASESEPATDTSEIERHETLGVPPAFSDLTGLNGTPEGPEDTASDGNAPSAKEAGAAPADETASEDTDEDAERFYRSLTRSNSSARV